MKIDKMNIFKRLYLKYRIRKDERFLLAEGIREARRQKLEIDLESGERLTFDDAQGKIYLPAAKGGKIDVRSLIALVADNYPTITQRYLDNKKKLRG
jgi:hypothetical protein